MAPRDDPRSIRLSLLGNIVGGPHVPASVLADKLQALQSLFFHAAAAVFPERVARRGRWQNRFRHTMEFSFVDAHHGVLALWLDLVLPEPSSFLEAERDQALRAIDLVYRVGAVVQGAASRTDY